MNRDFRVVLALWLALCIACSPEPPPDQSDASAFGDASRTSQLGDMGPSQTECNRLAQALCDLACPCSRGSSCNFNQSIGDFEEQFGVSAQRCVTTLSQRICTSSKDVLARCRDQVSGAPCQEMGDWRALRVPEDCSISGRMAMP